MHKLAMLAAVGATGGALALSALPASSQNTRPSETMVLTGTQRAVDEKTIDLKPRGESVGDRIISSETLRRGAAPVARVESQCLLVDATYEGAECTFTIMFHDGVIIGQGASVSKRVPGVNPTNGDFAILGGTGPYQGASGSIDVEPTKTGHKVTLRIAS
jgi:hypothetical protein